MAGILVNELLKQWKKSSRYGNNPSLEGIAGVTSVTGLTGGDATRLNDYIHSGNF